MKRGGGGLMVYIGIEEWVVCERETSGVDSEECMDEAPTQ